MYWLCGSPYTLSCEKSTLSPRAAVYKWLSGHHRLLEADPCTSDSKLVETVKSTGRIPPAVHTADSLYRIPSMLQGYKRDIIS